MATVMDDLPLTVEGLITRLRQLGYVIAPTVIKRVTAPSGNATGMSYPIDDGELIVTSPPSPTYGQTLCTASASGNERTVKRFLTIDNNPCTFEGTVNDDIITGKYSCTRVKGPFDWHATIIH
jgi:hypothetical protein